MRYVAVFSFAALVAIASVSFSAKQDQAEQYLSEFKVYTDGSPLRRPVEDWEGARRRTLSDPQWARFLSERKTQIDDWIAKRRDHVDWVAGWYHDFVSPKDGSFLVWTPDEPGEKTLRSRSGNNVDLTPKLHAAWVYGFRVRHGDNIQQAAMLYRLTKDRKYAEWVSSQLDFYANNYMKWPLQTDKGKSRLMYQSLDEAVLAARLVNAARLVDTYVTAQRKQAWYDKVFKPTADLLDEGQQRIHNIACWHRSAVGQIAIQFKDKAMLDRALDGPFGIRKQLEQGVTADFFWYEQSLSYNSYVVQALAPFFTYAALSGRLSEVRREMAILENLMLSPLALRFPTGRLPTPADTTAVPQHAPNLELLASVYRIFPTLPGLAEAATKRTWDTLVDPPGDMARVPPLPDVKSANLESSRMAVIKKGLWQVYFHYGQLNQSHAQKEALNFEAFYGLTDITHDPGTVGYGSPLHRGYFTTGLAHNVPLFNGLGQKKWNPGKFVSFDGGAANVEAAQPDYQSGVYASRKLETDGSRLIDTVRVHAQQQGRIGLVLHVQGQVQVSSRLFKDDPDFSSRMAVDSFHYWENPRTASFDKQEKVAVLVRYPELVMRVTFELPGSFTLTSATSPDTPPARRDTLYLETSASTATFKTTFEPIDLQTAPSTETID